MRDDKSDRSRVTRGARGERGPRLAELGLLLEELARRSACDIRQGPSKQRCRC